MKKRHGISPLPELPANARMVRAISLLTLAFFGLSSTLSAQEAPSGPSTEAVGENPTSHENLLEAAHSFAQAKLLADEGRLGEAWKAYDRSLDLDGTDPYAHLESARFHTYLAQSARADRKRRTHLETATSQVARAREIAPENDDVLLQFAQIHLRMVEQNHFPSLAVATEAFETLRQRGSDDLSAYLSLGQLYLWQRRSEDAAEVLREASNRQPDHRLIQVMLVEALLGSDEKEEAETELGKLLEIDPTALEYRLRLADLLGGRRDHRAAVEVLKATPEDQKDNTQLLQILAQELHLSGDNSEALGVTDTLLVDGEDTQALRRLRVAILSSLARYAAAIDELVALLPGESEGQEVTRQTVLLSRLLERVGRTDEAARHLRELIDLREGREQLQLKLGLVALLERNGLGQEAVELAEEEFERALDANDSVPFARLLSNLLARLGRFEEAQDVIARARQQVEAKGDGEAKVRLELQHLAVLVEAKAWDDVVAAVQTVVDSKDPEAREAGLLLKAEALTQLDRVDEALEILAAEESDGLLVKRLEILSQNGREPEAQAILDQRLEGAAPEDLLFVAQTYQRLERYGEAVPLVEQLMAERGENIRMLYFLGALQERAGDFSAAETSFQKLLEGSPDYAPALNYLGYMWAERGQNLEQAVAMLHRAVALEPDNGAYVDSLGWAYFQLGQYEEARLHLEWAVRLVPNDPTILEHLGDIYERLQQMDRARDSYRQALDVGGEEAERLQQKLRSLGEEGP